MISDISDISDDIRRDAPGLLPDASKNTEKRRSVNSRSQKSNTKKNTSPDAGRQSLDAYGLLTKEQSSRVNTPIFARDRRCVASEPRHNMTEMQSIGDIISNTGEPSISLRSSETPLISPEDYIQIYLYLYLYLYIYMSPMLCISVILRSVILRRGSDTTHLRPLANMQRVISV
jgi:hypothetical protein